jgi:hypothetical protein
MTSELPVSDAAFDLVLNRHGLLDAAEISRVLQPGGGFRTQQVGSSNDLELNEAFGLEPVKFDSALDNLEQARELLEAADLTITRARRHFRVPDISTLAPSSCNCARSPGRSLTSTLTVIGNGCRRSITRSFSTALSLSPVIGCC